MRKILFCLLLGFALAACGTESPSTPSGGGGMGGMGGAGGSDGTGGSGGSGGSTERISPDGSGWEGIEPRLEWREQGFGNVSNVLVADFTGDGDDEIAVGARRPLLLEGDGSSVLWYHDWEPGENLNKGSDGDFTYGLAAIPSEAGGADLLVTSSLPDAYLIDGRTGERIWHSVLDADYPRPTVFGDPDDPLFFTAYGKKAYRAKTGDEAWELEIDKPTWATTIRWYEDEASYLLLGCEMDQEIDLDGNSRFIGNPWIQVVNAEGQIVFEKIFPQDEQLTGLIVADLDGEGIDTPVLHFDENKVRALHPDGSARWETTVSIYAETWHHKLDGHSVGDVDGDGTDEILLLYTDISDHKEERMTTLVLLGADGQIRWTYDLPYLSLQASLSRVGEETIVLAAVGNPYRLSPGALIVLDPTNGGVLLRHPTFNPITHAAIVERDGVAKIAYAGIDGYVRTLDWPSGEEEWDQHWLNWVEKSTSFEDGDEHFVAVGESYGTLSLYDSSGARRWHQPTAEGEAFAITALAGGRLGGEMRLVAGSLAPQEAGLSLLETYTLKGHRRYALPVDALILSLRVDDLDGDGTNEILYVGADYAGVCRLYILNEAGVPLHTVELGLCETAQIATGDSDGDGKREIAVHTHPGFLPGPPLLFFVEHDGAIRWFFEESIEITLWIEFTEYGLVTGGGGVSGEGFVALRDFHSGEKTWRTALVFEDGVSDASIHGITFQAGGEYIATHTAQGLLFLLDQNDGYIFWKTITAHPDENERNRASGAPLVFVPGTESTPAFLAASQGGGSFRRSRFYAVSLSGNIMWEHQLYSPVSFAHGIHLPDGRPAATVMTALGIYTFALGHEEEK